METVTRICDFRALKTISGGIYHTLKTYNDNQITGRDWEYLHTHLSLPSDTLHGFELTDNGFKLYTKKFVLTYTHDRYSTDNRIIELKG